MGRKKDGIKGHAPSGAGRDAAATEPSRPRPGPSGTPADSKAPPPAAPGPSGPKAPTGTAAPKYSSGAATDTTPEKGPSASAPPPPPPGAPAPKPKVKAEFTVEDEPRVLTSLRFNFPIYALSWMGPDRLCIAGGGGSKYGMPNHLYCGTLAKSVSGIHRFVQSMEYDSKDAIIWSMSRVHVQAQTKAVVIGHTDSVSLLRLEDKPRAIDRIGNFRTVSKSQEESRKYTALTPCGQLVVVAQDDCSVACVRVGHDKLGPQQDTLRGHTDRITDLSTAPVPKALRAAIGDSKRTRCALVATAAEDRTIRLWRIHVIPEKTGGGPLCLASVNTSDVRPDKCLFKFCRLHPDGASLYALSTGMGSPSYITIFELRPRPPDRCDLVQVAHRQISADSITAFTLSSDGTRIVCGDNEGVVYVLQAPSLQVLLRRTNVHDCPITSIDISRDNRIIASADLDATVKFYLVAPPLTWARCLLWATGAFALLLLVLFIARFAL